MAELDPSIIFRQEKYSGPTQDELDAKQDMNALRNMLGAGQSIDSPEVINAMMARNPDMGLKLQSNASTMQTNAASAQKSIADARAKDQEARLKELERYFPVGMTIAQAGDQEGWDQFGTFLGQKFGPEALMGYPRDVKQAGEYLQGYLEAKKQYEAKNGGNTRSFGALTPTDAGMVQVDPGTGEIRVPTNPATGKPFMPLPRGSGDGGGEETFGGSVEYMVNEDTGEVRPLQRGSRGTIRAGELPKGFKPVLPSVVVDQGVSSSLVNKGTGEITASFDKNVREEALQKKLGDLEAAQIASAGSTIDFGTVALQQIDGVLKDPNLSKGTGIMSMVNFIPGTGSYAFQAKVDQVTGAAFLQGIQRMQGTGAITEIEGAKATAALTRAMTGLGEPEFRKAMEEYRSIVEIGLKKARALEGKRTGLPAETGAATPAPAGAGANPADPLGLLGGE
jgi:hypothetical protein